MKSMDKKELILQEASVLFAEKGYYGLGLSELLKRCEIPKGSFYYYFPDGKIQLVQEVLEYSYQKMVYGITHRMLTGPTALASFERMIDRLATGFEHKRSFASLLLSMIAIESVYLDERVQETCNRIYAQWQQLYRDFLMQYGFDPEESAVKAQAIFAMVHGSLISSWIKHSPDDLLMVKKALPLILDDHSSK